MQTDCQFGRLIFIEICVVFGRVYCFELVLDFVGESQPMAFAGIAVEQGAAVLRPRAWVDVGVLGRCAVYMVVQVAQWVCFRTYLLKPLLH